MSFSIISSFLNTANTVVYVKRYVSEKLRSYAYTHPLSKTTTGRKKKNKLRSAFTLPALTDFRDAGEEDPNPDEKGRFDARELDADDAIFRFRRMFVAARGVADRGVIAGARRGELQFLRDVPLSGIVAARRREAAQGGVVREGRADHRAHRPEAQTRVSAVQIVVEVAGVDLRSVRLGMFLFRDPLRGSQVAEKREIGAAASRTAQDHKEERGDDHRSEATHGALDAARRRRRRRCFCRGRSAPSSALVRRR